jgi:hypothetical protein
VKKILSRNVNYPPLPLRGPDPDCGAQVLAALDVAERVVPQCSSFYA